ncbi:MAG: hypothetical protein ACT4OZ_04800 [Gemmatimonadota bacterium]
MIAIVVLVLGAAIGYAGTHHVVQTRVGIRVYPKSSFTLADSYVNVENMRFIELRSHMPLVAAMTASGDLALLPGGETMVKLAAMGQTVNAAISSFATETELGQSLTRLGASTMGAADAAVSAASRLDAQYDISGKAATAASKAADAGSKAADKLAGWLNKR